MIKDIDMSGIYKEFMLLPIEDADEYITIKSEELGYTKDYFYTYLSRYAKSLTLEQFQEFSNKKIGARFLAKKQARCIVKYLEGENEKASLLEIGDKEKIIYYLDKCAIYLNDKVEDINNLKQQLDSIIIEVKTGLKCDHMTVMLSILIKDEKDAFDQIKKYNLSKELYYVYLDHFIQMFPNELEKIKYLRHLGEQYYKNEVNMDAIPSDIALIRRILLSGISIEEYCSNNGGSLSDARCGFRAHLKRYSVELSELRELIEDRDNEEFYRYIKLSVYKILNNKDFDMLDYYEITHLSVDDYLDICRDLIYDSKILKKITDLLHKKNFRKVKNISPEMMKQQYLVNKTYIDGKEVSLLDKKRAIEYVEEKDYPIQAYSLVLKRILKGKLPK